MIKVTDEMVEAYRTAGDHLAIVNVEKVKARLEAVLKIVNRERLKELREIRRKIGDIPNGSGWDTRAAALTILFNAEAIR